MQATSSLNCRRFLQAFCQRSKAMCAVCCRLDLAERIKAPFRAGTQRSSYSVAAQDMAAEADSQNVPLTFEVC